MKHLLSILFCFGYAAAQPARFQIVDSTLYRGAAPESQEDFAFLAKIGVKTILSVDRAKPAVASADAVGIKYIQIPIGYNTVPRDASVDMLRAFRSTPGLQGPFYIHCHAGKFRVGAMAACYRIAVNHWSPDSALAEMVLLGGSDKYKGLNKSILEFKAPTEKELAAKSFDPDKAPEPAPFSERMSAIDKIFDDVKKMGLDTVEAKGNALELEEKFAEIHRLKMCRQCDSAGYAEMLSMSNQFQTMRRTGDFSKHAIKNAEMACMRCHERIRN